MKLFTLALFVFVNFSFKSECLKLFEYNHGKALKLTMKTWYGSSWLVDIQCRIANVIISTMNNGNQLLLQVGLNVIACTLRIAIKLYRHINIHTWRSLARISCIHIMHACTNKIVRKWCHWHYGINLKIWIISLSIIITQCYRCKRPSCEFFFVSFFFIIYWRKTIEFAIDLSTYCIIARL